MTVTASTSARLRPGIRPHGIAVPEEFDEPPISVDAAASLMRSLGFVAFRTPAAAAFPDSCLMAVLRATPTHRHFDAEVATFWVNDEAHGRVVEVRPNARLPLTRPFSWGRIRLVDRLDARNSFVTFGGVLHAERVGPDATLLVFRSTTPILRLRGHSQRADPTADAVLSFFGRIVPRLWDEPGLEQRVAMEGPEALYAAFVLDSRQRIRSSTLLREAIRDEAPRIERALRGMAARRPTALAAGRQLSEVLALNA